MKLKSVITLALVLFLTTAFGQKNKEVFKAKRVAFITQFLELTTEEAKDFWPVYEEKIKEQKEKIKPLRRINKQNRQKLEDMSDSEVLALINTTMQVRQKQLDIDKKYNTAFLKILPPKKVAKLYHIERKFRQRKKSQKSK